MKFRIYLMGLLMLFSQGVIAQQSQYRMGTTIRVNEDDTLYNNVMIAGQVVEVMGYLDNDLFAASRHLILNGTVTDDAIVAGQIVSVRGSVGDMLMAAGETVVVDGPIEGDLFAAGAEVRIAENARVRGNAFIAGGSVYFEGGVINGALRMAGDHLELNGQVNNFVELYSDDVTFGSGYDAAYSTTITSSEPIHRENLENVPESLNLVVRESNILEIVAFQIWFFVSLFITGLILIRVFQKTAIDMHRFATERFWKNTGIGLLSFLLIPLAILVLMLLMVTIPLSVIIMLLYGLALLVSYLLVAMTLGAASIIYFRGEAAVSTYYWGLGLGMIYVAILVNLPFVGWLFNILLLFFGLGSLVYYIWKMSNLGKAKAGSDNGGREQPIE